MTDTETLIQQITDWAHLHLDANFEFRHYQLEAIVAIVQNVLNDVKAQAMNAPTGSGKSLTAIIAAGVLYEYYEKTSYILVSDLSLFNQYEQDLLKYKLEWGHLKGKDNYICEENGNLVSCGECSLNMISASKLSNPIIAASLGYSCASECEYIQQRKKAVDAPVTLMTYQLYLIQRNYVRWMLGEDETPFKARDFVICDEAHKLTDIVQSHFAPRIPTTVPYFMKTLNDFAEAHDLPQPNSNLVEVISKNMKNAKTPTEILKVMSEYEKLLAEYCTLNTVVRDEAQKAKKAKKYMKYMSAGNCAREHHCKFEDFLSLVNELNENVVVKTDSDTETVINCTHEGYMITKYLHNVSNCELFMSATLGNFSLYKNMIGMQNCEKGQYIGLDIPSTFHYEKSPIYYSDKNPMSYAMKATSIRPICETITKICQIFKDHRGIIQTGNYENSKNLLKLVSADVKKRLITYHNSKEKDLAIESYLESSNGILVGPTLLEGLNFDGDKCRFSICMKLPYANLADNLTAAKKALIPDWYAGNCISSMEQGFGRGVRFDGDWCVNFILDGCFANLLRYSQNLFSSNTLSRIKLIK